MKDSFEIKAIKKGSKEMVTVLSTIDQGIKNPFAGPINGADKHVSTSVRLPEPGIWRLMPYVDGKLIDSIVIKVT
ncbi:hypothetical protein [Paenibacillus herberti]|uniref:YtkA-like domain-containing protein n=1 Tax=Paenibacillus herberti TaxID=1619309 RepID=A0A229NXV4_9BACL|nr:hypothetical protein [Paenibacillus herberti]OXM14856.1 hypothetical protein CGZ75_18495 [Paenibacillus herberti]